MSRLTRDGTAEPVKRDQILRRERGQGNINFPCSADHEQDRQPYPVDPYSQQSKFSVVLPTPIVTVTATGYVKPPCLKLGTFFAKEGGGPRTQQYRRPIVLYSRSDPGLRCIEPVAKRIFSTKLLCSST